jgi:hypothetical protein
MQPHACELNHKDAAMNFFARKKDNDLVESTSDLANNTYMQAHDLTN